MKKVIDFQDIEKREKELIEELSQLRAFKKYATKFGADYGQNSTVSASGVTVASTEPADAIEAVKLVITEIGQAEFNYKMLETALTALGKNVSRSSIFVAIASLKDKGDIEVVSKGAGRRPAQYKATAQFFPF